MKQNMSEGRRIGVASTPTFVVNNQIVKDWSKLDQVIDSLLTPAIPKADTESGS